MAALDFETVFIPLVLAGVIVIIAFDLLDLALAGLIGLSMLVVFDALRFQDLQAAMNNGGGSIALLFGGMVVARTLVPTGIFDIVGAVFLRLTKGDGRRFLIGLMILVAPLCAFLPNATIVVLLGPVVVSVCRRLEVDFILPLILTAIISNTAGMLTLVGDPATFVIGTGIGLTFGGYLQKISLGGLAALLAILPLLPIVGRDIWRRRIDLGEEIAIPRLERPALALTALAVLALMIALFLFGELLPHPMPPPAVAIVAAALALLVLHGHRVETVEQVFRDIDWKTLVFLGCIFVMVEAVTRTGMLQGISRALWDGFGKDLTLVGAAMLVLVGVLSCVLANIPVAVAMTLVLKSYFVIAGLVPEEALASSYGAWPDLALPTFTAMMFGATLGGNATLIGASANIVGAGIAAAHGRPIGFGAFMKIGVPITLVQLLVGHLYALALSRL